MSERAPWLRLRQEDRVPGPACQPPRLGGAESGKTAPPPVPSVSIARAVAGCHPPRFGRGVRSDGWRWVAPTPWAVTERGAMPGGGCHPRSAHRGVRNAHLHGCHRARAELMGHAPRRCGVCRLVEPLGLIHTPNGLRSPAGPVTANGDGRRHLAERLWPKIAGPWASTPEHQIAPDDCWLWDGALGEFDYGRISVGRRGEGLIGPHRAVLEVMDAAGYLPGTAPDRTGLVARHSCDNPRCCNPAHLCWGTPADNAADMVGRGRQHRFQPRPTVDARAYARHLESEAVLHELDQEAVAELEAEL